MPQRALKLKQASAVLKVLWFGLSQVFGHYQQRLNGGDGSDGAFEDVPGEVLV